VRIGYKRLARLVPLEGFREEKACSSRPPFRSPAVVRWLLDSINALNAGPARLPTDQDPGRHGFSFGCCGADLRVVLTTTNSTGNAPGDRARGSAAWPISRASRVAAEEGTVRDLTLLCCIASSSRPLSADDITFGSRSKRCRADAFCCSGDAVGACLPPSPPGPQAQAAAPPCLFRGISPSDQRYTWSLRGPNCGEKPRATAERGGKRLVRPPLLRCKAQPEFQPGISWPNGPVSRGEYRRDRRRHHRASSLERQLASLPARDTMQRCLSLGRSDQRLPSRGGLAETPPISPDLFDFSLR